MYTFETFYFLGKRKLEVSADGNSAKKQEIDHEEMSVLEANAAIQSGRPNLPVCFDLV